MEMRERERETERNTHQSILALAARSRAGWCQHITSARDVRGLSGFGCLVFLLPAATDMHLQRSTKTTSPCFGLRMAI